MACGLLASNAISARWLTLDAWVHRIAEEEPFAEYLDSETTSAILAHQTTADDGDGPVALSPSDVRTQEFLYRLGAAIVDYRRRGRQAGTSVRSSVQGRLMSEFAAAVLECVRYDANTAALEAQRLEDDLDDARRVAP